MKKIILTVLTSFSSIVILPVAASAQIVNTGPGSNNQIITNNTSTCTSTSSNSTTVTNTNSQSSNSGSSNTSGNTNGGSATSGSSSNSNQTSTSVTATNNGGCVPASSNPSGGNGGGGSGGDVLGETVSAGGQGAGEVLSLPETGVTSPAEKLAALTALTTGAGMLGLATKRIMSRHNA